MTHPFPHQAPPTTEQPEQLRLDALLLNAKLIAAAADLTRAIAYEDGTYIRSNLEKIDQFRTGVRGAIALWKPELLA